MYRKANRDQLSLEEFFLPFGGRLSADNRWVKLARLMPWDLIEDLYAESFKNDESDGGAVTGIIKVPTFDGENSPVS